MVGLCTFTLSNVVNIPTEVGSMSAGYCGEFKHAENVVKNVLYGPRTENCPGSLGTVCADLVADLTLTVDLDRQCANETGWCPTPSSLTRSPHPSSLNFLNVDRNDKDLNHTFIFSLTVPSHLHTHIRTPSQPSIPPRPPNL